MITRCRFLPGLGLMSTLLLMGGLLTGMIVPVPSVASDCRPTAFPLIADCSPTSPAGKTLALTVSADGQRLYAGNFSGVWRLDLDNGPDATWHQLTRPQPRGVAPYAWQGLWVPNVFDVVISPDDKNVVMAATAYDTRVPAQSKNGIYWSSNGGDSWRLVHQFQCPGSPGPGRVGQIVFAPDNAQLVYFDCLLGLT